ncbi:MAG: dihydrofolate reductase [Anaeroplasmataceae bacterium]
MINLIWAMDEDWLIGANNRMPWHIKEDLLYYKEKTQGKNVFLGYNNYISLKGYYKDKPLPYGNMYVATRKDIMLPDAKVINDPVSFLANFKEELWVIGGSMIYELAMPYASNLYISFIKGHHEGDTYFPKFDLSKWKLVSKKDSEMVSYQIYNKGE